MSEPITSADPDVLAPIRVAVENNVTPPADFGAFYTFKLLGTEAAQRFVPQSRKRSRAVIMVGPGFLDNNTLGNVYIGTRAQVQAQSPQGGVAASGYQFEYHAQGELWIIGDGTHSLTVTVLDERYA